MSVLLDLHSLVHPFLFRSKKERGISALRRGPFMLLSGMCPDAAAQGDVPFAQKVLSQVLSVVAQRRGPSIRENVAAARSKHPQMSQEDLARMFIKRRAFYSGVSGGATSLGGVITLPFSLPASVASSLIFQAEILLTVAHIYDYDLEHEDRVLDLALVMAGSSVNEAFKALGIAVGTRLTRQMVDRLFTRHVMYVIWRIVGKQVLTKAGTKSTFSIMRAVPLVAGPIGFAFDYTAARTLGKGALMFYGGDAVVELDGKTDASSGDDLAPGTTPAPTP